MASLAPHALCTDDVYQERTLTRWYVPKQPAAEFRTSKDLTEAFSQLKEVFLADMGATHAGNNPQLMAEGANWQMRDRNCPQ